MRGAIAMAGAAGAADEPTPIRLDVRAATGDSDALRDPARREGFRIAGPPPRLRLLATRRLTHRLRARAQRAIQFVARHGAQMSGLSFRKATRNLPVKERERLESLRVRVTTESTRGPMSSRDGRESRDLIVSTKGLASVMDGEHNHTPRVDPDELCEVLEASRL